MKRIKFRPRRAPAPLEKDVQAEISSWLDDNLPAAWRHFATLNGVALGGSARSRAKRIAALKRQGFKKGVPDIVILNEAGLFVCMELKRPGKASTTSDAQDDWIEWAGGRIAVVTSVEEAKAALVRWGVLQ